jgi:hypothetical protein
MSLAASRGEANHLHRFARFSSKSVNGEAFATSFAKIFFTGHSAPSEPDEIAETTLLARPKKAREGVKRTRTTLQKAR